MGEMWQRFRRATGRLNLLSLLTVLGGSTAVTAAAAHQSGWAWAVGTTTAALGPTIHVLAVWLRAREARDWTEHKAMLTEIAALRAELDALKARLGPPILPPPLP